MILFLFGVLLGTLFFALFILGCKLVNAANKTNPLLGIGAIYLIFHFASDKLVALLPESWIAKEIHNIMLSEGSLAVILHLDQPRLSIYDIAILTMRLCILGYFIYIFTLKKRRDSNQKSL